MTFRYGFELEGFYILPNNEIALPPDGAPVDGFPGLVEARTVGGKNLRDAYFDLTSEVSLIVSRLIKKGNKGYVDFHVHEHTFTAAQKANLRATRRFEKDQVEVSNIYGKTPRDLRGKTIASFQINISHCVADEYKVARKKESDYTVPERYGLLNIPKIVRNLDNTFKEEIRESGRQPGMFAIKDGIRLEYRSLPNFVWEANVYDATTLMRKIKEAVEGE